MSNNPKNIIRDEYLKNFTKNVENRIVLIHKGDNLGIDIGKLISKSNSKINVIIQKLNIKIAERQIPYITLKPKYGDILDKDVRIMLRNYYTKDACEEKIKQDFLTSDYISHLLDFLIVNGYNEITLSDLMLDAELVIDKESIEDAITDIIVDLLMFNSYSFLRSMSIKERREFSKQKFDFFKKRKLNCFYEYNGENLPYYSLAFSARNALGEFDINLYINYWNDFIQEYYPNCKHKEQNLKAQIEQHVDYGELPKNYHKKFYHKENGAYLIIRTNKERSEDKMSQISSVFGISEYEKGKVKIVPMDKFKELENLFQNLDVSAFKVVKS